MNLSWLKRFKRSTPLPPAEPYDLRQSQGLKRELEERVILASRLEDIRQEFLAMIGPDLTKRVRQDR